MIADGDLGAGDALLDDRDVVVGVGVDHRARQPGGVLDDRHALRRPALRRLHDERQRQLVVDGVEDGVGAELAERVARQGDRPRRRDAGAGDQRLRGRLVPGEPRRLRARPDERDPEELEQAAERAVLAARAVQRRPHDIRPGLAQVAEQRRVRVAQLDLEAVLEEAVGDAAPGAQRDVALVRDAAGEDDDVGEAGG